MRLLGLAAALAVLALPAPAGAAEWLAGDGHVHTCHSHDSWCPGEDPSEEALRRLGVARIATKYPRIAGRWAERTGRQVEIVEVKGSVELAPLTGLVEGIVDLTATGTTLRENGLVIREEIAASTARLIANPVAHKLKAAQIDRLLERIRAA